MIPFAIIAISLIVCLAVLYAIVQVFREPGDGTQP